MKRLISVIILALALCQVQFLSARGIDPKADSAAVAQMRERMAEIRKHRPTVALVLSGGGAKGAAHIGVIEHIEGKKEKMHIVMEGEVAERNSVKNLNNWNGLM